MTECWSADETRDAAERERALMAALPEQVRAAQQVPAFAALLAGIDPASVGSRAALARLPVTRKHELLERQLAARARPGATDPFGGHSAAGWSAFAAPLRARRVFQSPGPLYEPEGEAPDYWRVARALHAAGVRAGDLVHNSFSYHLTPAGSIMETGAQALGCTVFPGGVGNTELQLQAVADLKPRVYCGTPSFLRILLDKAAEGGATLSFERALVSGEACPPSLRAAFAAKGIDVYQCYATADVGLVAYETRAREGLVLDERVIVEIVRPGTGDPVPDGEVGEIVVTVLNPAYPLLRFGTGDLSAILPGACPSGRTAPRIRGWMGRADQTTKVRGMFVHPGQVAEVLRRHGAAVQRARLVVGGEVGADTMTLRCEVDGAPGGLAAALVETLRDVTKLRGEVELVAPGSLPNDGKVIEDGRRYD
ncbi:MAG TPA: AMP-binding protein [Methylibium sp.]|nr:AMP-binding protein [Methylibium sp.]